MEIFWFIFWAVILICIVVLTGFVAKVLFELSSDLKNVRTTIDNTNEITTHIAEGTKKTSEFVANAKSIFPAKLLGYLLSRRKKR